MSSSSSPQQQLFLMKSEPDVFSITDLSKLPNQTSPWDGVRNFEARKTLNSMNVGDLALMYHSNAKKETGVVGIMEIVRSSYPDVTCIDSTSEYYDDKATDPSKWVCVDCKLIEIFKRPIYLEVMKSCPELEDLETFKRNRLSITHLSRNEFDFFCNLARNTERPTTLDTPKKRKAKVEDEETKTNVKPEKKAKKAKKST
jgi:predicted RNA-binding protein with PUA-like domain